jgi:hypothetical protein
MEKIAKDYAWDEGNLAGNFLYYEVGTGRIVGEVARQGMQGTRSRASSYIDVDHSKNLGNYIDASWAKLAVERHQQWYDSIVDSDLAQAAKERILNYHYHENNTGSPSTDSM